MNKMQYLGIFFVLVIAAYGVSNIYAQGVDDPVEGVPEDCPMDGSGALENGNQRGAMDGSQSQTRTQLKDGSGAGGMYGEGSGDGTCDQ